MIGLALRYGPTVALVLAVAGGGWWAWRTAWTAGRDACRAEVAAERLRNVDATLERMRDADTGGGAGDDDAGWLFRRGQGAR